MPNNPYYAYFFNIFIQLFNLTQFEVFSLFFALVHFLGSQKLCTKTRFLEENFTIWYNFLC